METINAKLQELKATFVKIDGATAITRTAPCRARCDAGANPGGAGQIARRRDRQISRSFECLDHQGGPRKWPPCARTQEVRNDGKDN